MKAPSHLLGSQLSLPLHPPERRRDFQNSAPRARGPSEAAVPTSKPTGATRGSAAAGRCGGGAQPPWGTDGQPEFPLPCCVPAPFTPARPDPLPRVHSLPTVLKGRACGVLSFSPAPASWGFSDILETSWSRPDACGGGYTLFGPRQFWVHVLPASLGRSPNCSKLPFLRG